MTKNLIYSRPTRCFSCRCESSMTRPRDATRDNGGRWLCTICGRFYEMRFHFIQPETADQRAMRLAACIVLPELEVRTGELA
jgi:hypothetical protein